jgi:hypothetical protein
MPREVSDLRAAQSHLAEDNGQAVEANKALEHSFFFLSKEAEDLRKAHARRVVALMVEFTQKNRALCEELAKCETSHQQENAALREQQDGLRAQLAHEIVTFK